jgi:predicted nucleic acid-binding protein
MRCLRHSDVGRVSDSDLDRFATALAELPIEVARDPAAPSIASQLARRLHLTAYDAAYLELAKRRSLPLATLDARLRAACGREGVTVLP